MLGQNVWGGLWPHPQPGLGGLRTPKAQLSLRPWALIDHARPRVPWSRTQPGHKLSRGYQRALEARPRSSERPDSASECQSAVPNAQEHHPCCTTPSEMLTCKLEREQQRPRLQRLADPRGWRWLRGGPGGRSPGLGPGKALRHGQERLKAGLAAPSEDRCADRASWRTLGWDPACRRARVPSRMPISHRDIWLWSDHTYRPCARISIVGPRRPTGLDEVCSPAVPERARSSIHAHAPAPSIAGARFRPRIPSMGFVQLTSCSIPLIGALGFD